MSRGEDSLGRLFKELNRLIRRADKPKGKNNSEISVTGEIMGLAPKKEKLIYGLSIELERGAKK